MMKFSFYFFIILVDLKGLSSELVFKERIMGGDYIKITEAPYQVCLMFQTSLKAYKFRCGGALISSSIVLTAAHCLTAPKTQITLPASVIRVYAGTNSLKELQTYSNVNRISLPFRPGIYVNDIALLKMQNPFLLSDSIKPINLRDKPVVEGTLCKVSGWGANYHGGKGSIYLMQSVIPIVNKENCSIAYEPELGKPLHPKTICAGFQDGGVAACKGDSGGPLVCDELLTGIVSFGKGCGKIGFPGVYTDVSQYADWISMSSQVGDKSSSPPGESDISVVTQIVLHFLLYILNVQYNI